MSVSRASRYSVTNDPAAADFDAVEALLRTSYWAAERPRDVIEQAFRSPAAIPFFVLDQEQSIGSEGNTNTGRLDVATQGQSPAIRPEDPAKAIPPKTVGFGRVVTDRLTIGWLCDVMIHPDHRGAGVGKLLVGAMVSHPDLDKPGVRLILATKDAHGLYEQFAFARRELMWRHPMAVELASGF